MLCDRVIQHVAENSADAPVDFVELEWNECTRRALRKRSSSGRELKILLPIGVTLRHGDVLGEQGGQAAVVVRLLPCEVLVVRPDNVQSLARLALEIGNLHAPAEISDTGELLLLPDGPVEAVLETLGVAHEIQLRRFTPIQCGAAPAIRMADSLEVQRTSGRSGSGKEK